MAGSDAYVAFLRGVNVSGRNLLKMNELKAQLSMSGIEGVQTYLQSGNILFKADRGICKSQYSEKISDLIREANGLDIHVITFSGMDLRQIVDQNSFLEMEPDRKKLYYIFLGNKPNQAEWKDLAHGDYGESFVLGEHCIYAMYPNGYGKSKRNNNFFERKLGVWATTRNQNTVNKMLDLLEE